MSTNPYRPRVADFIVIAILLLISVVSILLLTTNSTKGTYARITVDGALLGDYPLNKEKTFTFKRNRESNQVVIHNGVASIKEANCPDQICVRHKSISKVGESIICLPHKLVVEIIGPGSSDEPDAIVR